MSLASLHTAALVSALGCDIVERCPALPPLRLQELWKSFRRLQSVWQAAIRQGDASALPDLTATIFASECLTRLWGGILAARDEIRRATDTAPFGRYLLLGHRELARRAFQAVHSRGGKGVDAESLWQLQHRIARWTDQLLGHLLIRYSVRDYSFTPQRAMEFGAEYLDSHAEGRGDAVWSLRLASLGQSLGVAPADAVSQPALDAFQRAIFTSIPPRLVETAPAPFHGLFPAISLPTLPFGRRLRFAGRG